MRRVLLVLMAPLAATAAITFPASAGAQSGASTGFTALRGTIPSGTLGTMQPPPPFFNHVFPRVRHDGDHHRRRHANTVFFGDWYGGQWALYNNRDFDPDSYNGWWHDNPDRAYPAWMRRNRNCDRMWWSGDTLIC